MPAPNQDESFTVSPLRETGPRPTVDQSAHPTHLAMNFGVMPPAPGEPDEAWAYAERAVQHSKDAWRTIAAKQSEFIKPGSIDSLERQISNWSKFAKGEVAAAGVHVRVARERIDKALKDLGAELGKPPEASAVAPEIRSYIRDLEPFQRMQLLRKLVDDEDGETLAAVLNGPKFLTGLTAEDIAELRQRWAAVVHPDLVARRAMLGASLEAVGKAERALARHVDDYITRRLSGAARAAAAAGDQAA